tara:strand:- start:388 stop:765 length:378 start_codon:yes stop_codon:yes gene_type:complete
MLIKYTRMEEAEHFKTALKQDVFLALRVFPKVRVLLQEMLGSLEKDEIDPSVAARINQLALVEVEKMMNILLMLKSNLEHFEDKSTEDRELLTEKASEGIDETKQRIDNLIGTIQSMSDKKKLED